MYLPFVFHLAVTSPASHSMKEFPDSLFWIIPAISNTLHHKIDPLLFGHL
jgi:hypothetical protein